MLHKLMAQATIFAQEAVEDEPQGVDLLIPDANEAIAGTIAFIIIFGIILWYVLPRVNEILAKRQDAIDGQITEAENAKTEAESLLTDYKAQLADAKSEGDRIIDDARQTAEAVKADIVARANTEADDIRRKALADAATERERVGAELRGQVATLSLDVAEKVVAASIDREGQQALVDRYIDDLGGMTS